MPSRRLGLLTLTVSLSLCGCSQKAFIPPEMSAKPCIRNFSSGGSFLSGQIFRTSAVLSAVTPTAVMEHLNEELPKRGLRILKLDRKAGFMRVVDLSSLEYGPGREVMVDIAVVPAGKNVELGLSIELLPAQFGLRGDMQDEFCQIIEASQIQSLEY